MYRIMKFCGGVYVNKAKQGQISKITSISIPITIPRRLLIFRSSEGLRHRSLASKMTTTPMGPPPPRSPPPNPNPNPDLASTAPDEETSPMPPPPPLPGKSRPSSELVIPYEIPSWSETPGYPFSLEVLKDGTIIQQLDV